MQLLEGLLQFYICMRQNRIAIMAGPSNLARLTNRLYSVFAIFICCALDVRFQSFLFPIFNRLLFVIIFNYR